MMQTPIVGTRYSVNSGFNVQFYLGSSESKVELRSGQTFIVVRPFQKGHESTKGVFIERIEPSGNGVGLLSPSNFDKITAM